MRWEREAELGTLEEECHAERELGGLKVELRILPRRPRLPQLVMNSLAPNDQALQGVCRQVVKTFSKEGSMTVLTKDLPTYAWTEPQQVTESAN